MFEKDTYYLRPYGINQKLGDYLVIVKNLKATIDVNKQKFYPIGDVYIEKKNPQKWKLKIKKAPLNKPSELEDRIRKEMNENIINEEDFNKILNIIKNGDSGYRLEDPRVLYENGSNL